MTWRAADAAGAGCGYENFLRKRRIMKKVFLLAAALVLVSAGCGKAEKKPAAESRPAARAQTVPGKALEQAQSVKCVNQLLQLGQYFQMIGSGRLPAARDKFVSASGCAESMLVCPDGGGKYEYLLTADTPLGDGGVPVVRCPKHGVVLYANGRASVGR